MPKNLLKYCTVFVLFKLFCFNLITLESLIIVYTRNMFFDKISLLHAVIRALHDFRRGASRGAIFFFRPENF